MKKAITLLVALVLMLSLVACSSTPATKDSNPDTSRSLNDILDEMEDDANAIESAQGQIRDELEKGNAVVD